MGCIYNQGGGIKDEIDIRTYAEQLNIVKKRQIQTTMNVVNPKHIHISGKENGMGNITCKLEDCSEKNSHLLMDKKG